MIIEFLDIDDEVIGTIRTTLTGIRATGAGRTVLQSNQRPSRFPLSDAAIMNKYSEWSNGYERSRVRES